MIPDDGGLPMSSEEFRLLAEIIQEHCGLHFLGGEQADGHGFS